MKNITIKSLREKQKSVLDSAEKFFQKPKNEIKDLEEKPRKPTMFRKIISFVFLSFFVLTVGGIGGILIDRFVLPYLLVKYPELNQYEFLKRVNERTITVETTKEIKISEDKAAVEAIKKVLPSVAQISKFSEEDELMTKGAGIILTSDGFIITSTENITRSKEVTSENKDKKKIQNDSGETTLKVKLNNGKIYSAKSVEKDFHSGLAIIKIDETNLPVVAFGDSDNLELGEKIITLGDSVATDIISKFVSDYTSPEELQEALKNKTKPAVQKRIMINSDLDGSFSGAAIINVQGEIIGISQSGNLFIPISETEKFINSAVSG